MQQSKRTILIVDDDAIDRMIIQKVFKTLKTSNDIVVASNVGEAITHVDHSHSSEQRLLIFLDLNLQTESGFEVLEYINTTAFRQSHKIHILSTSNYAGDRERAQALGADDYLVKPNDMDGYVELLEPYVSEQ